MPFNFPGINGDFYARIIYIVKDPEHTTYLGELDIEAFNRMLANPQSYTFEVIKEEDNDTSSLEINGELVSRAVSQGGAKKRSTKYEYKGRKYTLRTGSRGGQYIVYKGEKKYV